MRLLILIIPLMLLFSTIAAAEKTRELGDPQASMQFHYVNFALGGNSSSLNALYGVGVIDASTPKRLIEALNEFPTENLLLNSPGGSLIHGLLMGKHAREAGLHVGVAEVYEWYWDEPQAPDWQRWQPKAVPSDCISACAFAFLGGAGRSLNSEYFKGASGLGFHQFYRDDSSGEKVISHVYMDEHGTEFSVDQLIVSLLIGYLNEMGIKATLLERVLSAGFQEVWRPSEDELEDYGIVTIPGFRDFDLEFDGDVLWIEAKEADESLKFQTVRASCNLSNGEFKIDMRLSLSAQAMEKLDIFFANGVSFDNGQTRQVLVRGSYRKLSDTDVALTLFPSPEERKMLLTATTMEVGTNEPMYLYSGQDTVLSLSREDRQKLVLISTFCKE